MSLLFPHWPRRSWGSCSSTGSSHRRFTGRGPREYHTNSDGIIPCTNSCGQNVKWSTVRDWWIHEDGIVACQVSPYEGQEACPLQPNDDDPDYYDEKGWART